MSLKMFHIVFIILSTATALGFGFWALKEKTLTGEVSYLYMGVGSLAAGITLIFYFFWFVGKMKGPKA